jgi:hypothetical protein
VFRCLAKSRDRRVPHVSALAASLEPFASPEGRVTVERILRLYGPPEACAPPSSRYSGPKSTPAEADTSAGTDDMSETTAAEFASGERLAVIAAPVEADERSLHRAQTTGKPRRLRPAVFSLVATSVLVAGVVLWQRAHPQRFDPAPTSLVESATAATTVALRSDTPTDQDEPPKTKPAGPMNPAPAPRAATAPVRSAGTNHNVKPSSVGSTVRKAQVDRNGVPILD